jgi:hypothetical protein
VCRAASRHERLEGARCVDALRRAAAQHALEQREPRLIEHLGWQRNRRPHRLRHGTRASHGKEVSSLRVVGWNGALGVMGRTGVALKEQQWSSG